MTVAFATRWVGEGSAPRAGPELRPVRLLHALPGRARFHLATWDGIGPGVLVRKLLALPGVTGTRVTPASRTALLFFDPLIIDVGWLERQIGLVVREPLPAAVREDGARAVGVVEEPLAGRRRRLRIPVAGLDRDPSHAQAVLRALRELPGVSAISNPLTSRVLVEFDPRLVAPEELLAAVTRCGGPAASGEEHLADPLDRSALVQSSIRLAGGLAGLTYIIVARLLGARGQPQRAVRIAASWSILQSSPFVRPALRRWLGRSTGDAVLAFPGIALHTWARGPIGLALAVADALRLLSDTRTVRAGWRRHEERLEGVPPVEPGMLLKLEAGQCCPLPAEVGDGVGTLLDESSRIVCCRPGTRIRGGSLVQGGSITVRTRPLEPFVPPVSAAAIVHGPDAALRWLGTVSLAHAAAVGLAGRSPARAFRALLSVNGRAGIVGVDAAETGARARAVRFRATVVGTRSERRLRRPGLLLLGTPRLLTDGLEIAAVHPMAPTMDETSVLDLAAAVSDATGAPWGELFRGVRHVPVEVGVLDGRGAAAAVDGHRYLLREVTPMDRLPPPIRRRHQYDQLLALQLDGRREILGVLAIRPRLAEAIASLRGACERLGIRLELLAGTGRARAGALAKRAGVRLADETDAVRLIRAVQAEGERVTFASDSSHHGLAFACCDLAVGVTRPGADFAARADLLVPDLAALEALIETLAKRDAAARDAIGIAALSNVAGAVWSLRREGAEHPARPSQLAAALALGWNRYLLRGGDPRWAAQMEIVDPRPERWGRHEAAAVLAHFGSSEQGLSSAEARARRVMHRPPEEQHAFLRALLVEARSPLIGLLAAGGVAALALGSPGDVVVILVTLGVNVVLGAWQNLSTSQLAATLEHVRDPLARARRDGASVTLTAGELVPGDILVLAAGDRVAADARLVKADGLELDESALTGETFPVPKTVEKDGNSAAIVLAGTDVTVGTGLAVVVGVGIQTRMGALAAALAHEEVASALGARLAQLVHVVVPIVVAGGALVVAAGLAWGQPVLPQIALGLSIALAAFPEGLPLMAAVGQSAAARRLIRCSAFVRRTGAIEALGRVDVACVDKTGTLTEGRLALQVVSDLETDVVLPAPMLESGVRHVLLTAALASPHPGADHQVAHPTDTAVIRAARRAGLGTRLEVARDEEARFNSARGFHGSRVAGTVVVKGAFELLLSRCTTLARGDLTVPLDEPEHGRVLGRAQELAARGLRVLLVADGTADTAVEDPRELRVVGLIGLSDPLRDSVPDAVRRCQEAGIRVVMLTGDHPLTARTIATEAGLLRSRGELFNAADLVELKDRELERRLEGVTVIARAAPLDKLRIVGALQRAGHTVAMTGDGINDAPALRLADAGVAMGRAGTEVARHAADLVLGDDDFTTLVETLVEGRGFWHNIRRALGLLLGGNLGELAVVVAAAALGRAVPLTVRQILATNLITDALPALAIVTQRPEHRHLAMLAREGSAALDRPLRTDITIRAVATALPTTGAYLLTLRRGLPEARSVAFASIVATQLAQTVLAGRAEGTLTRPVGLAVAASGGAAGLLFAIPSLRRFFDLAAPSLGGWLAIGISSAGAPLLSQALRPALGNGWRVPASAPVPRALPATL